MRYSLFLLFGLSIGAASAQTARFMQPLTLAPTLQTELPLRQGDYLLLALFGARATHDYSPGALGLDERSGLVGYEHFWSDHWSWGATARLQTFGPNASVFIPEVLVRHRAPSWGGVTLGQRLSVERSFPNHANYLAAPTEDGQLWGRLRVDVEKLVPIGSGGWVLRPRLSYEASTHLRLQKAATDLDERTIQYTSLRGEVGVRVSPAFDFTPWVAYQTNYLETLPQYDKNGMQVSGGRVNYVTPVVGLDLRLTLAPLSKEASQRQLPTQH